MLICHCVICAGVLVQMLRSEDPGVHYEAVGVLGNLVHSSQDIKQQVLQVRHAALANEACSALACRLVGPGQRADQLQDAAATEAVSRQAVTGRVQPVLIRLMG
jgi:hypothetical protein